MADEPSVPDECEVTASEERVKISFGRDDGTSREAELPREGFSDLLCTMRPGQRAVGALRGSAVPAASRL